MTLLSVFVSVSSESRGKITVTQPAAVSSALGGTVTIPCRVSQDVYFTGQHHEFAWYQQKDGETPKMLFYYATTRVTGISSRFTGTGSHSNFALTISEVQTEDAAVYHCQNQNFINNQFMPTQ
ncbi:Immunoglobulin kappa variable 4-1 [Xyrichtys novacula]|nr:Immunoglobulin kappa variable 4-1 [Xyrichtys novacula]